MKKHNIPEELSESMNRVASYQWFCCTDLDRKLISALADVVYKAEDLLEIAIDDDSVIKQELSGVSRIT